MVQETRKKTYTVIPEFFFISFLSMKKNIRNLKAEA